MSAREFAFPDTFDVVIVGAGAAGLGAARHLMAERPDMSLLVLEADSQAGGRARTIQLPELNNKPIDLGCGWLHGARTNVWTLIAKRMGQTINETPAPWDRGGRILNGAPANRTDVRIALESFFDRVSRFDDRQPDGTLSDMLEPGNPWNEHINAIGTYINGVELDKASILDLKRYDPGLGPDWRVSEGLGALVVSFGRDVPLSLETVVLRIDHQASDKIRLETSRGSINTRVVLVTVSTNVLASNAIRFSPALPQKIESAAKLPLGLANKIFLRMRSASEFPSDARLFGSYGRTATGAYQVRPFGVDVVEGFFAGHLAHDLERAGDRAATAFAVDELAGFFGNGIRTQLEFCAISKWGQRPTVGGAYSYAIPGASADREKLSATIDDRLFFAGEACSSRRYSTAHGAYESGIVAASEIARSTTS
jgi:monoamine oxidase